jgi:hypothetical protein
MCQWHKIKTSREGPAKEGQSRRLAGMCKTIFGGQWTSGAFRKIGGFSRPVGTTEVFPVRSRR